MFDPFSRTRTLGFNVRPQDDLPGFRLDPEAEVPSFNIDENGLPRPRSFLDSGSSVQPTLPQATADPSVLDWLRRSLALSQPLRWTPPALRWPPAGDLGGRANGNDDDDARAGPARRRLSGKRPGSDEQRRHCAAG
jgi:hypothetical protein